jgi:hypothetical protein
MLPVCRYGLCECSRCCCSPLQSVKDVVPLIAKLVIKYGCHDAVLESAAHLDCVAELWGVDRAGLELAFVQRSVFGEN